MSSDGPFLDDFLLARAGEVDDEDDRDLLVDLVGELRDIESSAIASMALYAAGRWSDHPDHPGRDEFLDANGDVRLRGRGPG